MFISVSEMQARLRNPNNLLCISEDKFRTLEGEKDGVESPTIENGSSEDVVVESFETAGASETESRKVSPGTDSLEEAPASFSENAVSDPIVETGKILHMRSGPGRMEGQRNRTDAEKLEIAELAIIFGPTEAARLSGCSQSQASSYSKGFGTTQQRNPDGELGKKIVSSLDKVRESAIQKILKSLDLLDEDKMNNLTPVAISQVAVNLSKIPSNLEGRSSGSDINQGNTVQVVIYSPPVRDEEKYKTIALK